MGESRPRLPLDSRVSTSLAQGPVAGESDSGCNVREPELRTDVGYVAGNRQAYIEDPKRRKGPDADQPHRIADEKLVRA